MPRQGIVLHNRWNPEDLMGCIDVLRQAGVNTTGMSIARIVGLALKSYLQASRESGQIPTRDGFEYNEMLAPYLQTPTAIKLKVSESLYKTEVSRVVSDLPASQFSTHVQGPHSTGLSPDMELLDKRIVARIAELSQKRAVDELNFGIEEQDLLIELSTFHDELWTQHGLTDAGIKRCNELLHK